MKNNPITLKLLIMAEATRIIELLNSIPPKDLSYTCGSCKEKAELKAKMKELRRDTVSLEKALSVWGGAE